MKNWFIAASLLILAGGHSSRLGTPKHLLPYRGATLIEHVQAMLAPAFAEVLVSSRHAEIGLPGARSIADAVAGAGPLAGIAAGLEEATCAEVFVVACDMPHVTTSMAEFVLRALPRHDAAVPRLDGRPQPTCAAYARTALPGITKALEEHRLAAAAVLEALNTRFLDEPELRQHGLDRSLFWNVNTPAEYELLAAESRQRTSTQLT